MPSWPQPTDAIRRMLLQRILTDKTPRGVGYRLKYMSGPLSEVLNLRSELDDALRRGDWPAVADIRSRARELLSQESA